MPTKPVVHRATATVTNVGNAFIETSVVVPVRTKLRLIKLNVTAGTAINQVAGEVRESSGGDARLAYSLAAEPLTSEEELILHAEPIVGDPFKGTLYIAVKVDDATLDHTVEVLLDFDVMA